MNRFKRNYSEVLLDYEHFAFANNTEDAGIIVENLNNLITEVSKLKKILNLISEATSHNPKESVKEILRDEIKAIDTVTDESAEAWNDYILLSEFFREFYDEDWEK